jgi:hypothetical protein
VAISVLHSEAIEFLNEIANTNPEILQSAPYIDLRTTTKADIEIVFHCRLTDSEIELLKHLANKFVVTNYPNDVWVIS